MQLNKNVICILHFGRFGAVSRRTWPRDPFQRPGSKKQAKELSRQEGYCMHAQPPSTSEKNHPGVGGVAILWKPYPTVHSPGPIAGVPEHRAAAIVVRTQATGDFHLVSVTGM